MIRFDGLPKDENELNFILKNKNVLFANSNNALIGYADKIKIHTSYLSHLYLIDYSGNRLIDEGQYIIYKNNKNNYSKFTLCTYSEDQLLFMSYGPKGFVTTELPVIK